jgi:hypothetical protein
MERELIRRRQYFWRAVCRRHGLKRSAIVIARNIEALAKSQPRQTVATTRRRPAPSTSPRFDLIFDRNQKWRHGR